VCVLLQAGILGTLLNLYRSGNPVVRPAAFNALFVCIELLEVRPAEPLWMEFSTSACPGYIRNFVACAGNRSGPCADACIRALVDHLIVLAEYNGTAGLLLWFIICATQCVLRMSVYTTSV